MRVYTKTKNNGGKKPSYQCSKCEKPIIPGQKYFEYKHRYAAPNRRHVEHGAPKQSEMCTGKMSGVYAAIEGAEDTLAAARGANSPEGLAEALRTCAEEVDQVKDEYTESKDNMPQQLQDSSSGEAIQEKIDGLEQFVDALNTAADEVEGFITEWEEMEEPDTQVDHSTDCASLRTVEAEAGSADDNGGEGESTEEECDCGYEDAEAKYDEWEREHDEKAEEAFDAAENALQDLPV